MLDIYGIQAVKKSLNTVECYDVFSAKIFMYIVAVIGTDYEVHEGFNRK